MYQGKTKGLVLGNYVVLDKIGQGGMGHVYQAQHRRMKRVVALKVLPSAVARSEKAVERFQREVEAAAKLSHPHVVTAYDANQADGFHFLVMEYVAGTDLSALVRRDGPLPVATALDYVLQAARGLAYAHAQGVIHRDIKPSNLLLDPQGTVKILDLGLARFQRDLEAAPDAPALTQTGQLMGTVDFIAPEQAMDTRSADARSDIYSLGCTLFYLLTGRAVYPTGSFAQKVVAHMTRAAPSLRKLRDEVPAELDTVFQRLVAKRPEERPQSMEEVIAELESCRALVGDSGQASQDTSAIFRGPTGGGDTEPSVGTVAPKRDGSGSAADPLDEWFQEELPATPTLLRSHAVRKPGVARQLLVIGAIGVGVALVGLLLLGSIVTALRTEPGTLVVEVNESGATVQVLDAEDQIVVRGVSEADPLTFSLEPGTHRLRVEKDGFTFFAQEFTLERRGQQVVRARLEPVPEQPGTVRLTVNQPDAAVEVLDMAGKTVARYRAREEPLAIPLAAGSYRVLVEKTGFDSFETTATVTAGVDTPIDIALAATESPRAPSETSGGVPDADDQPENQEHPQPAVAPLRITRTGPEPPPAIAPFDAEQARQHQQAWAAHLGIPVEWTNSIGMKFVLIPPGEFDMGSAQEEVDRLLAKAQERGEPQWYIDSLPAEVSRHRVRISEPWFLGVHEVTVDQFRRFVTDTGYATDGERDGQGGLGNDPTANAWVQKPEFIWRYRSFALSDNHPVVQVSWNDALAFCEWLSRKEGKIYRLPTDAEWEYACRAGSAARYYFGEAAALLGEHAWFLENSNFRSHPICQKQANLWGLYDMYGNVWEWCRDTYGEDASESIGDPQGYPGNVHRLVRGGSWCDPATDCRSAFRGWGPPDRRSDNLGFRVAAVIPQSEASSEPASSEPAICSPSVDAERRAATWVLAHGGSMDVLVNDQVVNVRQASDLPAGEFHIKAINARARAAVDGFRLENLGSLPKLETLWMEYQDTSDSDLEKIKNLSDLRGLNVSNTLVADAGLDHLKGLRELRDLSVGTGSITDEGLRTISQLSNLEILNVRGPEITDLGAEQLNRLTNLRQLIISDCRVTDRGVKLLCESLANLELLTLNSPEISDAGLPAISALHNLRLLHLGGTSVTGDGLAHLAAIPIAELFLDRTRIHDDDLRALQGMNQLRRLDLVHTRVTSDGLQHLTVLPDLSELTLNDTDVDDAGLEHLKRMPNLHIIRLRNTRVTVAGVAAFCRIAGSR